MYMFIRRIIDAHKRQDDGATAVEYGLMVAAIAAVIVLAVFALGNFIHGAFSQTCSAIQTGGPVNAFNTSAHNNCNQ